MELHEIDINMHLLFGTILTQPEHDPWHDRAKFIYQTLFLGVIKHEKRFCNQDRSSNLMNVSMENEKWKKSGPID